jgi:lipoprotein-releasing system ATP-binding protein
MSNPPDPLAVQARGLTRSYRLGRVTLDVLKGVSFRASPGEFVAITGASGSGKSTLLHLLGLLDLPTSGEVIVDGVRIAGLSGRRRNQIRCRDVGFVFQFYHLLGELNVMENVTLPAKVECSALRWPARRAETRARAKKLLERLGLKDRLRHRPKELSGGERQRVAIARALMNRPKLLLADEPTGNLDSRTGGQILEVLRRCNQEDGQTIVMVTHDMGLAKDADRYVVLKDGLLVN